MLNKWVVAYLLIKGVYCIWDYSLLEGFFYVLLKVGIFQLYYYVRSPEGTQLFFSGGVEAF